jgi:hypothetical protein
MSAYLDKSQGITFVYSNIFELYKKAKDSKLDAPFVAEKSSRVIKAKDVKLDMFQARELTPPAGERPFPVPMGVKEAEEKRKNMRPIANLQKNLSELTDAHEKLRFLLEELDSLTKKKN